MANYILSEKVHNEIYAFYINVSDKYKHTYSEELMLKNINDAYNAIYKIENGLLRQQPTLACWEGLYMAVYKVNNKSRWYYAYRIDGDTIYVEDARHAQNMSDANTVTLTPTTSNYRSITKRPLFGYKFVLNNKNEYNLIDETGKLVTQWFKNIKTPFQSPYGKYQLIAHVNVGGMAYALGMDGKLWPMGKMWKDLYTECMNFHTPYNLYENIMNNEVGGQTANYTESFLYDVITEVINCYLRENLLPA